MARKAPAKAAKKAAKKAAAPRKAAAKKAAPPPRKAPHQAAPRRPAQIPKAQWDKLAASTRKRYAGYFKKHPAATVQQARGHKEPRESQRRQQTAENFVENYALQQAMRERGGDFDSMLEIVQDFVKRYGMKALRAVGKKRDELHERYRENGSMPLGVDLSGVFSEYVVPPELLWYH